MRKHSKRTIRVFGIGAAVLTCGALLFSGSVFADHKPNHKPGGGGGGGGGGDPLPADRIYFEIVRNGCASMLPDGSGKRAEPCSEPSYLLHDDGTGTDTSFRWMLGTELVEGTYPDGTERYEVFAVREDGAVTVQLTDDSHVQPREGGHHWVVRWSKDDSFISFVAVKWHSDNAVDASSHIMVVDVGFNSDGEPFAASGALSIVSDPGVWFSQNLDNPPFPVYPVFTGHDWSPDLADGLWIVYGRDTDDADKSARTDQLELKNVLPGGAAQVLLVDGEDAEWSPDGNRIAFQMTSNTLLNGIYTIAPDGTDLFQVLDSKGTKSFFNPHWSPDSKQLAVGLFTQSNQGGKTTFSSDVVRVSVNGKGAAKLLTDELLESSSAIAWR